MISRTLGCMSISILRRAYSLALSTTIALLSAGACPADLVITEFSYNPASSQGSDSSFEYVVLRNDSLVSLDLLNYSIDDLLGSGSGNGSSPTTLPTSLIVDPSGYLVVSSGASKSAFEGSFGSLPSAVAFVSASNLPALNNSGDEINVLDANDNVVFLA